MSATGDLRTAPMRVLFVSNMYPPHFYGGYELMCRDIVTRFAARGHATQVLTTVVHVEGVSTPPGERARGVHRDLRLYWDDHDLLSPPLRTRAAWERWNHRRLVQALDTFRPDVVSVWHMGAMSLSLLTTLHERRVPLVYVVCDDWLDYAPTLDAWTRLFRRAGRPLAAPVRALLRVPTTVPDLPSTGTFCFISGATRRFAEQRTGLRFPDATVVWSGVDRRDFPTLADGDRPWRWRLLYTGRIDERKGVDTAIRALGHLPDAASLDVVGRGDDDELTRLRGMAGQLGVAHRVRFAGGVDRAELAARYRDADVFAFTSRWDEPFGVTPLEAMASRTPVVGTATGGSGEYLLDGVNCLRFGRDDHLALAAAVRRLADDPSLRRRLTDAGVRTAQVLDVEAWADVLERWHRAAADRFAHGRPADRVLDLGS